MKKKLLLKDQLQLNFILGPFDQVVGQLLSQLGRSQIILPTSLNDLAQAWHHQSLADLYQEVDLCTTDGIPLVWFFRQETKQPVERVYGPDLMEKILAEADPQLSHYFLGAAEETVQLLEAFLAEEHPQLKVAGWAILPKNHQEEKMEQALLKELKSLKPDVLWLGLGSPKQVKLAIKYRQYLPQTTIFCVGAAFALLTNHKPQAPSWIRKLGFEWFFRLIIEPKRLASRYLFEIPSFLISYWWSQLWR